MEWAELKKQDRVLIPRCGIAKGFFVRFMGLMGRKGISQEEGLAFPKCNSIHTFFMRFPIDVILVDAQGEVVEVIEAMRPWRMLLPRRRVAHTVEMKSSRAKELGILVGDKLICSGAWV